MDPRVLRTRKLIGEAFLAVLNETGFEELSIQDVADSAGINRATFYAHYADKYDLMADLIRKSFTERLEEEKLLQRDLCVESVEELFRVVCTYVAGLHGHCKPPHRHLDWMLEQELPGYCADLFFRWTVDKRTAPETIPFQMKTTAAAGAMYALILKWLGTKKRVSPQAFVVSALPVITAILGIDED
jgi:AcrR family transcriptional regulator